MSSIRIRTTLGGRSAADNTVSELQSRQQAAKKRGKVRIMIVVVVAFDYPQPLRYTSVLSAPGPGPTFSWSEF